jgi:hypothetical protein
MIKVAIVITIFLVTAAAIEAFTISTTSVKGLKSSFLPSRSRLGMIGGMGWGNDDYLSSLGGSDEEKKQAREGYDEFKETREAFILRQKERMNSPSGQKFLQQLSENPRNFESPDRGQDVDGGAGIFFEDIGLYNNIPRANESRFQNMMRQAAMKKMVREDAGGNDITSQQQ